MSSNPLARWWAETGEGELGLILWSAWDPIGMVPRDEYDSYVPRIWDMLRERRPREEIAAQPGEFRTQHMSLPPDEACDLAVAGKLCEWIDAPGPSSFRPVDLFD